MSKVIRIFCLNYFICLPIPSYAMIVNIYSFHQIKQSILQSVTIYMRNISTSSFHPYMFIKFFVGTVLCLYNYVRPHYSTC